MKSRIALALCALLLSASGCKHSASGPAPVKPTAYGAALVLVSGDKQLDSPGAQLGEPLVVQVNDKAGNAVTGAPVTFTGPNGASFDPAQVLTDASGQAATVVSLGGIAGRSSIVATSSDSAGKPFMLSIPEIAAGYQQRVGYEIEEEYCARCHDSTSTPQRVSNYDNLEVKPHAFSEGETYNKLSAADLTNLIVHGGPALNRSPLMPAYGGTLTPAQTQAIVAYIRLVADPPYQTTGVVNASH